MTAADFRAMLEGLGSAWMRRDYARAIACFAAGVAYADPTRYMLRGAEALRAFFENDEGREQTVAWHTIVFDEPQQTGMAEYTYVGSHTYHGVVIVRVAHGRITHWREYQHVDDRPWEEFAGPTRF
jgi:hypothetical protein